MISTNGRQEEWWVWWRGTHGSQKEARAALKMLAMFWFWQRVLGTWALLHASLISYQYSHGYVRAWPAIKSPLELLISVCCCSLKAVTVNMEMSEYVCSNKTLFTKARGGRIWSSDLVCWTLFPNINKKCTNKKKSCVSLLIKYKIFFKEKYIDDKRVDRDANRSIHQEGVLFWICIV